MEDNKHKHGVVWITQVPGTQAGLNSRPTCIRSHLGRRCDQVRACNILFGQQGRYKLTKLDDLDFTWIMKIFS